jgi:hypothetical protein
VTLSKADEERFGEPTDKQENQEPDMLRKGVIEEGEGFKHEAEYQCEWPSQGKTAPESHGLHHHGEEKQAALGDEDEPPEPGTPAFWPSADLDQDEDWEPPARNKPDSSPWCERQEGEE